MIRLFMGVAAMVATGCAPQARLAETPRIAAPSWDALHSSDLSQGPGGAATWRGFGDPVLATLVARAVERNADLDATIARVDRARADVRVARAARLPSVNASGGVNTVRAFNFNTAQFSTSGTFAGIDVAYDLDLFGSLRAGKRAAVDRYRAAGFDALAARLVVETEVARTYAQFLEQCDRLRLLDRTIANARETLRVIDVRIREGAAAEGDRGVQAVEVGRFAAQRQSTERARRAALGALAVLTGAEAPGFDLPCSTLTAWAMPVVDPGLPGDLLFRRPDVLSAEATIAAARGDVDQARAAFLPSLRLNAAALSQSASIGGPLGATLSAGAGLLAPIFNGGRLRGNLEGASARQRETVAIYRQALLVALREGNDALVARRTTRERLRLFDAAVADARRGEALARRRFVEGDADLSAVLDAQRGRFLAEDGIIAARIDSITAEIDLYKALGGPTAP